MDIIDAHVHAFPDDLAQRAIGNIAVPGAWEAVGSGTVDGLVASMDAAGIAAAVTCAIATKPGQAEGILKWCCEIRGDRIIPFASVHPDTPGAAGWIDRIADEGLRGIKLHAMYQEFAVDDPRMGAICARAAERGVIIAFHAGRDIAFPDDDRAAPARLARVVDRHPDLTMICTHIGGWQWWDEVEKHLIGRHIYLETSFSVRFTGPERAAALIRRHGVERIMFGTDWPWTDQGEELEGVRGLGLSERDLEAVLGGNAAKLLGRSC